MFDKENNRFFSYAADLRLFMSYVQAGDSAVEKAVRTTK